MLLAAICIEFACAGVYFKRWRWSFFYLWLCGHLLRRVALAVDRDIAVAVFEPSMLTLTTMAVVELGYCLLPKGSRLYLGLCALFSGSAAAIALAGLRLHKNVWGVMYVRPYLFAFLAVGLLVPVLYSGLHVWRSRWHWTAILMAVWLLTLIVVWLRPYRDRAEWDALNRIYMLTDCLTFSGWILVELLPASRSRAVPSGGPALI